MFCRWFRAIETQGSLSEAGEADPLGNMSCQLSDDSPLLCIGQCSGMVADPATSP